jgi:hypothetical protein
VKDQSALTEDDVTIDRLDAERILVVNLQQSCFFPCAKILNQFQVLLRKITYRIPSWLRVCLLILWGLAWAGFGIPWNG